MMFLKNMFLAFLVCLNLVFAQSKKRLPNPINTPSSIEYAPSVTADGQTLVYQSDQYGLFVNSAKKVPQITADGKSSVMLDEFETSFFGVYEVKLHPSGTWMPPKNIEPINQYASENNTPVMGGPSVSYDGNTIYFFANFGKSGYGREDIFVSERKKNGWSRPENIGATINTDNYEGFPSISPDGKKLYFTREILGKKVNDKQCYRIMVSEKARNGKWRAPYELPAPINMDCEKAPRILADGKTLVYSSIKKEGRGDFDLYKSTMLETGGWSEPINLDFINTKKSDLFVSISPCGDLMYYVTDGDIFTTTIPESLRPIRSATIQGFVLDSLSGAPLTAKIVVKNKETDQILSVLDNNPSDGRYTAIVPFGESYTLSVNIPEYFNKVTPLLNEQIIDCKTIPLDFKLQKIPTEKEEIVKLALNSDKNQVLIDGQRLAAEKLKQEQLELEKAQKLAFEKKRLEDERIAAEKLKQEQLELEKAQKLALEKKRLEDERLAAEKLKQEQIELEKAQQLALEKKRLEDERLAAEKLKQEQLELEKAQQLALEKKRLDDERLAAEKLKQEQLQLEKAQQLALEKKRMEDERLAAEKLKQEQLQLEKAQQLALEKKRLEYERLAAEKLKQEQIELEKAQQLALEKKRLEEERLAVEKLKLEQLELEKAQKLALEKKRLEDERLAAEKLKQEQLELEKAQKLALEKKRLEDERLVAGKLKQEQLELEKARQLALEKKRLEDERLAAEKLKQEQLELEKAHKLALEKKRLEDERIAAEKLKLEQLELEKAQKLALEKKRLENERLAAEKLKQEKLELEKAQQLALEKKRLEDERLAAEKLKQEQLELEKAQQLALEKKQLEDERLAAEKLKQEQLELEKAQKLALEKKRLEDERLAAEKLKQEQLELEKAQQLALEKKRLEVERLAAEKLKQEQLELEKAQQLALEKKRLEDERLATEKLKQEQLELEKAQKLALEKKRLEDERLAAEKLKQEQLELEKAQKLALEKKRLEDEQLAEKKRWAESGLTVYLKDFDSNQPLDGKIIVFSKNANDSTVFEVKAGILKLPLTGNDTWVVKGSAPNYTSAEQTVKIELPKDGSKNFVIELKLGKEIYKLQLLAIDLEKNTPIATASFMILDANKKQLAVVKADSKGVGEYILPKKGKYTVLMAAPNYQNDEQVIDEVKLNTKVTFKPIEIKVNIHELKLYVYDRFTDEELFPEVKSNNKAIGAAPSFIQGPAETVFDINLSGNNIEPENYKLAFVDSLILKVRQDLKAQQLNYEFEFRFYDKKTNKPIPRMDYTVVEATNKTEVQKFMNGKNLVFMSPKKNYVFTINNPAYEPIVQKINALEWIKERDFERNVFLVQKKMEAAAVENKPVAVISTKTFGEISKGKKITLENIYFDQSSPVLRTESFVQLDELVTVLKDNPNLKIEVRGHTDNVGDLFENVKLSKGRCESVVDYLVKKGIASSRLSVTGRGPMEPIAPNDNEANKKKNRRVEFLVL